MGDIMRPVPFRELMTRIASEYNESQSIFGIRKADFYQTTDKSIDVLGQSCATPVGPAAGPHTQLAQNIIASYLVGGRFMELKTVQIMDTLEIDKPCIDARDEAYNVEWSTEYTLEKAYDEYIKAWIILHLLEETLSGTQIKTPSFLFNMSVGYDLKGIKTEKMQTYINSMLDSSENEVFTSYIEEIEALITEGEFLDCFGDDVDYALLKGIGSRIGRTVSPSVTLSTMHGCPPKEIEAICSYMVAEKNINTFVKLNPTLLGYDFVRETLDSLGFDYLHLNQDSFDHDLQYAAAVAMLTRLVALAKDHGRQFGVKLTNTLGSINDQGELPGAEMYMSGRALYPLSINLAQKLSKEFGGSLPISYSGGANAKNVKKIFEAGIHPITLATDLLKPGGYARMNQIATLCEDSSGWEAKKIDLDALSALAKEAVSAEYCNKEFRGIDTISTGKPLPLFDCYVAPCTVACPIHQDIPEYLYLIGEGQYAEALAVIYDKNALPNITGHICDHQCMYNCTRMDYEGAVEIREMKRIAVDNGYDEYIKDWEAPEKSEFSAAVVGAGPAGLSAAFFLARAGFKVTVFEREESAGGVVRHVIPGFRLPVEAIEADIEFIKKHGVEFEFGVSEDDIKVNALKKDGYSFVFVAVGAEKDNPIPLEGDRTKILQALSFLGSYRKDPSSVSLGEHVAIVGGGNTAMDSARAALTVPGVKSVDVLYRRTKREMPADLEEYDNAIEEGAVFRFLTNPESMSPEGELVCRVMKLGAPDASGRRRPVATEETITLQIDSMITAIGESVDAKALAAMGIILNDKGWAIVDDETSETKTEGVFIVGDAKTGPSTVVECIASARKAVEAAIDKILGPEEHDHDHDHDHDQEEEFEELSQEENDEIDTAENVFFGAIEAKKGLILDAADSSLSDTEFGKIEAKRCLECSYICNKCVEVCPNRANVTIDVRIGGFFDNPFEIVHLDAYCNECGNCANFCPWEGRPFKDKFTIFSREEDFNNSENPGMYLTSDALIVRLEDKTVQNLTMESDGTIIEEIDEQTAVLIETIMLNYSYLLGAVGE